jgi:AcrR family transcriptional regulator
MAAVNRKVRAQETRERIARSAAKLFAERGYQGTPMDSIAADAGVAVQTVYFAYRTKPELLVAAFDQAVKGTLDAPPPNEQEWHQLAIAQADKNPSKAIAHFVDGVMDILRRLAPLQPVMISSPDDEVRVAFKEREQWRHEGYRQIIEELARHGRLRADLDVDRATDLLFAVLSPELHGLLCGVRGWAPDAFREWALTTLEGQLLAPRNRRRGR